MINVSKLKLHFLFVYTVSRSQYYNPISVLLPARAIIREFIVDLALTINSVTVAVLEVKWLRQKQTELNAIIKNFSYPKISICSTLSCPLKKSSLQGFGHAK